MKSLIVILALSFAGAAYAAIAQFSVDPGASQGLYLALVKAGAQAKGPATVSQTVQVTKLNCVGGFNEATKKSESNCTFSDGDKRIKVSGETANELLGALIKAKLISQGRGEMSGGSLRFIDCIKTNMDGAKTYACNAQQDVGGTVGQ